MKSRMRSYWLRVRYMKAVRDQPTYHQSPEVLRLVVTTVGGTVSDGAATRWTTLALRGTWRPDGMQGPHIVDFGVQQDRYELPYLTSNIAGDWRRAGPGSVASNVGGR